MKTFTQFLTESVDDAPVGSLMQVTSGGGFSEVTFVALRTADDGWRKIHNFTHFAGRAPAGTVGEPIDLQALQNARLHLLQTGLAGGDQPASIYDFAALPSGTVVASALNKTYTKTGEVWTAESGATVQYFHFEHGTYRIVSQPA